MKINEFKKKLLFAAFAAVDFFAAVELTAFIVAVPEVANYFNLEAGRISWILNSYLYVVFGTLVIFYLLSKRIKHTANVKAFFLFGLGCFLIGSVIGSFSTSIEIFYVARAIQGIGAAVSFIGQLWIMTYSFKNEIERPLFWTETGAALGVLVGPFLGGLLTDLSLRGWRYIFDFNAIISFVSILIVLFLYNSKKQSVVLSEKKFRKDFYYSMIIIVAVISIAVASEFVVSIFLQKFKNYSGISAGLVLLSGSIGLIYGSAIAVKFKTKKKHQIIKGLWGLLVSVLFMGLVLALGLFTLAPVSFFAIGFFYGFLGVVLYAYISHMLPQNLLVKGITIYLIALQLGNATGIYFERVWNHFGNNFFAFTLLMLIVVFVALFFAAQLAILENIEGDLYEVAPIRKTPFGLVGNLLEEIKNIFQALFYILIILPFKYLNNIKAYGVENIEFKGQPIVIANHGARLDAWIVLAGMGFKNFMKLHPFRIPIAKSIFDIPVLNILFRITGMYSVESKGNLDDSLNDTFEHIDNGHSILFFPEGRMVKNNEKGEPKKGIAHIVKKRDMYIIPAKIAYSGFNSKGRGLMRGAVIVFGDAVSGSEIIKSHEEENLHHAVMQKVYELEKETMKYLRRGSKLVAEIIEYTKENVLHIVHTHNGSFHDGGQYDDAEDFFDSVLKDKDNISIVLKDGQNVVGLLIARPHNVMCDELKEDDPHMNPSENRFYIETMGVLSEYRGKFGHHKMIKKVIEEARKRGVRNFSMHVRKSNGLSYSLQQLFGKKLTHIREIDKWKWTNDEPYHYIEGTFNRSMLTLSVIINSFIFFQKVLKIVNRLRGKLKRLLVG